LWRKELKPTSAPLVQASISSDDARAVRQRVSAALREYEDQPGQGVFPDEATMVLGFVDAGHQYRVSTSHTMAPELPAVLKLRFDRIVVDDSTREKIRARFTPEELAFIPQWDVAMNALGNVLRHSRDAFFTPRTIRWPGPN
jgi:hypothetical protein